MGNGHHWTHKSSNIQRTSVHLSYNRLLLLMGRSHPSEGSKDVRHDQIHETSCIYCFGIPRRIVHDSGPQFISQAFQRFCDKFKIQSVSSTTYYPTVNSLTEASNKTIGKQLKKFVSKVNMTGTRN